MNIWRSKLFWFVIALVILSLGLMLFGEVTGKPSIFANALGVITTPLQHAVTGVTDWTTHFFSYFYKYSELEEENARLKEELAEYQKLEAKYYSAINENAQLRKLTGLIEKHSDFEIELCEVTAFAQSVTQSGLVLNKGSSSGIEQGDSVITDTGLVGYVSTVGLNYCEVVTVLDVSFKAACKVARTRETVIAEGDFALMGEGIFKLPYLSNTGDIKKGDIIETSGYGGVFPKGIIVGTVKEVKLEQNGRSSYATLEPVADIGRLSWVYVVKAFEVVE